MSGPQGSISASPGHFLCLAWPGVTLCVNAFSPDVAAHEHKQRFLLTAYDREQTDRCLRKPPARR